MAKKKKIFTTDSSNLMKNSLDYLQSLNYNSGVTPDEASQFSKVSKGPQSPLSRYRDRWGDTELPVQNEPVSQPQTTPEDTLVKPETDTLSSVTDTLKTPEVIEQPNDTIISGVPEDTVGVKKDSTDEDEFYEKLVSEQAKKDEENGINYLLDPLFATAEGAIQSFIDSSSGKLMLNNKRITDLEFQKEFLELGNEMRDVKSKLNDAYLKEDKEAINTLLPEYNALFAAYQTQLPEYDKMSKRNAYFGKYGYQKDFNDRIKALDESIAELKKDNIEQSEDLETRRNVMLKANEIYKPSEEWKNREQDNWWYQIPRGMGSSASSLGSMAASFAASAGSRYLLTQVATSPAGAISPLISGAAAVIGAGVDVVGAYYSRNMESLAEVSNNYVQNISEYAQKNGISIQDIAESGRDRLTELTGYDYSKIDDNQVLQDMLAYDVATGNPELDAQTFKSKKNLQQIYDRNMALMVSDVAQTALLIPGAGKYLDKVAHSLNPMDKATRGTVKLMDKVIQKIVPGLKKTTRTKLLDYGLDPALRLAGSSVMEGVEEATQFNIGLAVNREEEDWDVNLLNPIDATKLVGENVGLALESIGGLFGISGNPELDGNKELADNFKVGMMIGAIMGGATQTYDAVQNERSYKAGEYITRDLLAKHISAKEDINKYNTYAKRAAAGYVRKEDMLKAIDDQIEDGTIPEGWTKQDLEKEKQNISDIYDIVHNDPVIKSIGKNEKVTVNQRIYDGTEDDYFSDSPQRGYTVAKTEVPLRQVAASLLLKARQDFQNSSDYYNNIMNQTYSENLRKDVDELIAIKNIKEEDGSLVTEYLLNKAYADTVTQAIAQAKQDSSAATKEYLNNLKEIGKEVKQKQKTLQTAINEAGLKETLNHAQLVRSKQEVSRLFFLQKTAESNMAAHLKTLAEYNDIENGKLKEAAKKYIATTLDYKEPVQEKPNVVEESNTNDLGDTLIPAPTAEPTVEQTTSDSTTINPSEEVSGKEGKGEIEEKDEVTLSSKPEITSAEKEETDQPVPETEPKQDEAVKSALDILLQSEVSPDGADFIGTSSPVNQEAQPEKSNVSVNEETIFKPGDVLTMRNYDEEGRMTRERKVKVAEVFDNGGLKTEDGTEFTQHEIDVYFGIAEPEVHPGAYARIINNSRLGEASDRPEEHTTRLQEQRKFEEEMAEEESYSKEDIAIEKALENNVDVNNTNEGKDLTNGTLYYQFTDEPIFKGFESGKALNDFISVPGNIGKSKFTAFVAKPNYKYGTYNPEDVATWDNAAIYVVITHGNKKYAATLKTIQGAKELHLRHQKEFTKAAEINLRSLRNQIISLQLQNPGALIEFNDVSSTNGLLNVNRKPGKGSQGNDIQLSVQRNLQEIEGLGLPKDLHDLLKSGNPTFGIGKGIQDDFIIMDKDGMPLPGQGGSGSVYIYPTAKHTINGQSTPIKLNEKRFDAEDDVLVNFILDNIIQGFNNTGIRAIDIVNMCVNMSEKTKIDPRDERYEYLKNKQFYLDRTDGVLYYGESKVRLPQLSDPVIRQNVLNFIKGNLHWNTEKAILFGAVPESIKNYMLSNQLEKLVLAPGFEFDLEDVGLKKVQEEGSASFEIEEDTAHPNGLSVLAWMIKNSKLTSDLQDRIFTSPMLYVHEPVLNEDLPSEVQTLRTAAKDPIAEEPKQEPKPSYSNPLDILNAAGISLNPDADAEIASKPKDDDMDYIESLFKESSFGDPAAEELSSQSTKQESKPIEPEQKPKEEYDEYTDCNSDVVKNFFGFDDDEDADDAGANKIMTKSQLRNFKRINTKKAKQWLKNTLGLTEEQIQIYGGVIKEFANGSAVYGVAMRDSIALSGEAQEGVQYHEAWHRVSLLMFNKAQREKFYSEFRRMNPKYKGLSNMELEEVIADRFMDFMINENESALRFYITKAFRNIKKFLHLNKALNFSDANQMFNAIKYGDFKDYKLDKESVKEFEAAYGQNDGAYYKVGPNKDYTPVHFPTMAEFDSAIDSLKACMFLANGARYISDIEALNPDKMFALVRSFQESNKVTELQKQALQEILDHKDVFMYYLRPQLEQMGIRQIDNESEREEDAVMQNYNKASYEFSKKNNALGSVKLFIATLPGKYFDANKKLRTRINNVTGLPMIVNYDEAFALILKNLSDVETYHTATGQDEATSLLGKCRMLSEEHPFFKMLYKRLSGDIDINLQTQLLQTIKSFNQNFVEVHYSKGEDGLTSFEVSDSANKGATKIYPSTWSSLFFNSDMVIHTNESTEPNKQRILKVIADFDDLYDTVNKAYTNGELTNQTVDPIMAELVALFNQIGINIDDLTINALLDQNNRAMSFAQLVLSNKQGSLKYLFDITLKNIIDEDLTARRGREKPQLDRVFMGLGNNSFVNKLALVHSLSHPDASSISVLGPNNNIIYTKTQNCYVSDLVRWLNIRDPKTISQLQSDLYCKHSMLLRNIIRNPENKVRLNTFVNFYGDTVGDKGRDYLSISPVEDYLAKMTFTKNNQMTFPTMADKKTWFTLSGVKLFNEPLTFNVDPKTGRIKVSFDNMAVFQMYNYWLDEFNTIEQYWKTKNSIPKNRQVKNYHSADKGGMFRHFTGYYQMVNGKETWRDLNAEIKEAIKDNTVGEKLAEIKQALFASEMRQATFDRINRNIAKQVLAEVETCKKLGIIEVKNGLYVNKLLDQKALQDLALLYKSSPYQSVSGNAEHCAVMTLIANHTINTNVSVIETEKVITGDVAFFKNDDDKIKRLGSVLSTGDNLRTQWLVSPTNKSQAEINKFNTLQDRQQYNCTILSDNEIKSNQYDLLKEMFTFAYTRNLLAEKNGLTESQIDEVMKDRESAAKEYAETIELAETLADQDAKLYSEVNQADAAVYIRPEMYRNIVQMLGEWSDEVEEAFNIMESNHVKVTRSGHEVIKWQDDPMLYTKALKTLIKPLKTTYFGYTYDENIGHNIPIFNKMAMFPMFKAIAIGDNREMYDRMNARGKYQGLETIDQVAFESAVKSGIIGKMSFYADEANEHINDLSKMTITKQNFRNLRRQLITDPHTHDRTLFGTQVSTVAVSNLIMDRVYGTNKGLHLTGKQIAERLFGTINAISNLGFKKVLEEFTNEHGELDYAKTSKALIREAHNSNMGKDVEQALELNEDGTDFKVPLSALPDSKWVETKIISINNKKSVDLELPGGAFIQMSSFGLKKIGVSGSRLLNIRKDCSMDSLISINLFSHVIPDYEKLSFTEARQWLIDNNIIGEKAEAAALGYRIPTQGLSSVAGLHIKDVLPSVVGDTIVLPDEFTTQTGSDFDIDKLYIARYNYEAVPEDGEADFEAFFNSHLVRIKGGSIVSQYGNKENARKEFVNQNKGKYRINKETGLIERLKYQKTSFIWDKENPGKSYEKNSREANENLLLETYLTVMTDTKNVDETRLPLDKVTNTVKGEVLRIVDGPKKESEHIPFREISPTYQMNKKYEYAGGKTGISPFALNNKNHVISQLAKLKFAKSALLDALGFTGLDGIKSKNEEVFVRDLNKDSKSFGEVVKDALGNPEMTFEQGLRILDWISSMINAHVDVAKDPYVIRLNIKQYTYNMCNFLLRCGFGKSTFYFLPQPILKEMADAYDKAQGIYGIDETKSKTAFVKEELTNLRTSYYNQYEALCSELKVDPDVNLNGDAVEVIKKEKTADGFEINQPVEMSELAPSLTGRDFLIEQLENGRNFDQLSKEQQMQYLRNQLLLSQLFLDLNIYADDMSKLVHLSQIDTKKYGNNFVDMSRFVYRLYSLITNSTLFDKGDLMKYYTDTFLNTKLVNGIIKPSKIFEDIMLRSKSLFKTRISQALIMMGQVDSNNSDLNKLISNEFEAQIRSGYVGSLLEKSSYSNLSDMFYGNNTMGKRLAKIKKDILNGVYPEMLTQDGKIANQLLNYLGVFTKMSTDTYEAPDIITKNRIQEGDNYLKQNLITYWEELLDSPYPEIKSFIDDMFLYQLVTTGGNFNKNGVFNLVPISVIQSSGYANYMNNQTRNFNRSSIDFDNFFLNNWSDKYIVKLVKPTKYEYNEELQEEVEMPKFPMLMSSHNAKGSNKKYPIMMMPSASSVAENIGDDTGKNRKSVYTPFIKVRIGDRNDPASTYVYKYVGNAVQNNGSERPLYVLVNKKGLNQNGRVIKEYSTSKSMFGFNNVDDALDANNISLGMLQNIINNSKDGKADMFSKIINSAERFDFNPDYIPVTEALKKTASLQDVTSISDESHNQKEFEFDENKPIEESENNTEYSEEIKSEEVRQEESHDEKSITFTSSRGKKYTYKTPFKLNEQQVEALRTLNDFVNNPEKYNGRITLEGYAGTGKTTIISIFDKFLRDVNIEAKYSSPTHRANAVTKQNNPEADVRTLHSLFGLSMFVDFEKGGFDLNNLRSQQIRKPGLKSGDLLIIDESSMVDTALYEFIKEFSDVHGVKVIFIGDPKQLSPVKDDGISPVFSKDNGTVLELTKVERTGDNPILEESTNLRNNKDFSYQTKVIPLSNGQTTGVEYMHNDNKPMQVLQQIIKDPAYKANPFFFRILSATNALLSSVNKMIREQLYGTNAEQIEEGELLIGFDNINKVVDDPKYPGSKTPVPVIRNSIDYIVTSVKKETKTMNFSYGNVQVEGYTIKTKVAATGELVEEDLFVLSNDTPNEIKNQIVAYKKALASEISEIFKRIGMRTATDLDRRRLSKLQTEESELAANSIMMNDYKQNNSLLIKRGLDYGYAHTIHKSQGGTYDKVMIFADTIETGFTPEVRQQLKYVAMSRAKQNVYVVTSHDFESGKPVEKTTSMNEPKVVHSPVGYNRQRLEKQTDTLVIFTDNTDRTSGGIPFDENSDYAKRYNTKKGSGYGTNNNSTTAIVRGLKNAFAITTMKFYMHLRGITKEDARWHDSDEQEFIKTILFDIQAIKDAWDTGMYKRVLLPQLGPNSDGFLNAFHSDISLQRTPKLYNFLKSAIQDMINYINGYKSINVHYGVGDNVNLSNMASRPFIINITGLQGNHPTSMMFDSVEKALQTLKFKKTLDTFQLNNQWKAIIYGQIENILNSRNASEAMALGKQNNILWDSYTKWWDEHSYDIMKSLIKISFMQNPKAKAELLATGNTEITHNQSNPNISDTLIKDFPKALMEVRSELQAENTSIEPGKAVNYIMHSGGAHGSDVIWGFISQLFGVGSIRHYWTGVNNSQKTPYGNVEISKEDYEQGVTKVTQAGKAMYGLNGMVRNPLLIRNWCQVKYADAVFAVGTLIGPGTKFKDGSNRTALITQVSGGTGYAVQMAITEHKPVYVFDQVRQQWFSNVNGQWAKCGVPTLTTNFAGIGTKELNTAGLKAMIDLFNNSFNDKGNFTESNLQKQIVASRETIHELVGNTNVKINNTVKPAKQDAFSVYSIFKQSEFGDPSTASPVEKPIDPTERMISANDAIKTLKNELEQSGATKEQINEKMKQFQEEVNKSNLSSKEELDGLVKKIICK